MKSVLKLIKHIVIFFGVLLSFIALMEGIRCYQTFYNLHPWAGYGFGLCIAALAVWLGVYYRRAIGSRPRALRAPLIGDLQKAPLRQVRRFARYLCRYLDRMRINPNLTAPQRESAAAGRRQLEEMMRSSDAARLTEAICRAESETIRPLLEEIDRKASRYVRDSMRDVMLFVTLSPYKSVDLAVVIYRNIRMVADLIRMYNTRPALREQLAIFYDILTIVATVNYIHLGKNLLESLGTRIPGVGHFLDQIAQGVGAGFLTTVTGHAAMQRCCAFDGWNSQKARDTVLSHLGDFYKDVRDIFFKDVWGLVIHRSGQVLDASQGAVASAIDETGRQVTKWIRIPADAAMGAGRSVFRAGSSLADWMFTPFRSNENGDNQATPS